MGRTFAIVVVVAIMLAHAVVAFAGHGGGEILRSPSGAASQGDR